MEVLGLVLATMRTAGMPQASLAGGLFLPAFALVVNREQQCLPNLRGCFGWRDVKPCSYQYRHTHNGCGAYARVLGWFGVARWARRWGHFAARARWFARTLGIAQVCGSPLYGFGWRQYSVSAEYTDQDSGLVCSMSEYSADHQCWLGP